jgi:hypothetical protein
VPSSAAETADQTSESPHVLEIEPRADGWPIFVPTVEDGTALNYSPGILRYGNKRKVFSRVVLSKMADRFSLHGYNANKVSIVSP